MSKKISLNKGLDIKLEGIAESRLSRPSLASQYAVSPPDFEGVTPKLLVKVGSKVEAGSALFFSKYDERVLFTSPVSGTVSAINRGEKRKILSVVVDADTTQSYKEFKCSKPETSSREEIIELLLGSGLWPLIMQRPYGVIANPSDSPKAIFVSTFDSSPLAPDYNFVLQNQHSNIASGVEVLRRLTNGKVHFGLNAKEQSCVADINGVEYTSFSGKHPVGNVGVQIHHTDPINRGDIVWTINIQDLAIIGRFFSTGKVDMTKIVALTGSEVKNPQYYQVIGGAPISSITASNVKEQAEGESIRYISGGVLTGSKCEADGFIGFYANQLTLIPEGDKYEFIGWLAPRFNKFSVSKSYFSWLFPNKEYRLDTNVNGGRRPFIVTGLYEKYLPMDIYPMHLLKAIMAGDIDKMENLGIYEVVEEDFALCEFVDPSKTDMQQVIRDGINFMIKEA